MAETTTDFLLRRVEELARAAQEMRTAERDDAQGQATLAFEDAEQQVA